MRREPEFEADQRDGLLAEFAAAVSSLARGELTFPAPFDLSSAAALAANIDQGATAQSLFEVTAARDCAYDVRIVARCAGQPELERREVLDTSVASTGLLVALLEGLLDELHSRMDD